MSREPSLPYGRQQRLSRVLAEYVQTLENGRSADHAAWLARYPEFETELRAFFAGSDTRPSLQSPEPEDFTDEAPSESVKLQSPLAALSLGSPHDALTCSLGDTHPRPMVPVDPQFGEYELLEEIGWGGMGMVYTARQRNPNRLVALKVIRTGGPTDAVDRQRFQNEADVIAQLDHPHIVPIYEAGEHAGQCFYSMKLIEGGSLARQLSRFAGNPRSAAQLMVPLADAIQHAHQRGVLHRDLKPSNILLDDEQRPFVTDFGLAQWRDRTSELTKTHDLVGSPPYMAPEQVCGSNGPTTIATDVYGLGAVLYALLTERPPAEGGSMVQVLRQIEQHQPPAPRSINPRVDPDLETICLKALQKQPHHRYPTAQAFADDLRRYLAGEPIQARPIGRLERSWLWACRHPEAAGLIATIIAALLLLVAGLGFYNTRLTRINERLDHSLIESHQAQEQALSAQRRAEQSEADARRLLYVSDMGLAAQAVRDGDVRQLNMLLSRHRPERGQPDRRSFEWHYLRGLAHVGQQTIATFDEPLYTVCYSPDGRQLAIAGAEAVIRMYDAANYGELLAIATGQLEVNGLAYSPDGSVLASAGDDGTVRLWDLATGRERLTIAADSGPAYQIIFIPAANRLATCGQDPVIRLWDAQTGAPLGQLAGHDRSVEKLALSPDQTLLASASSDETAKLWDIAAQREVRTFSGHSGRLTAIGFSPEGRWLATGALDNSVRIWNTASGKQVFVASRVDAVQSLAFSPNGRELAVGDRGGVVSLWRRAGDDWTGGAAPIRAWQPHDGRLYGLAFSPDGQSILSVADDGRGVLSDRPETHLQHILEFPDGVGDFTWIPGRDWIATAEKSAVQIYDVATSAPLATLPTPDRCTVVAAAPDGRALAAADVTGTFRLWDLGDGDPTVSRPQEVWSVRLPLKRTSEGHGPSVLRFSPDGAWFALAGYYEHSAWIFNARNGQFHLELPARTCDDLAFSPDSRRLAVAAGDDIQIWDVNSRTRRQTLAGHDSTVNGIAYSPDGRLIASTSNDRFVKLWDAASGAERASLAGHRDRVESVAFSHDGRSLVTSGRDRSLRVWNVATARPLFRLDDREFPCPKLRFSPDGTRLAAQTRGKDGSTRLLVYNVAPQP
jgi:eukaryotic-like serine/threonine-protein kinase